mgnify:CR=1 FL=1
MPQPDDDSPDGSPPIPGEGDGPASPKAAAGDGSAWEPPALEEVADWLPRYSVDALVGRGSMGAVYRGEQPGLRRLVAIKLLPASLAADRAFIARFEREAELLASLQHPGIVAVHASGQTGAGHPYFVMEYVDGGDLAGRLRSGLSAEEALDLAIQVAEALRYAHGCGVVHRDIKPSNILVTSDGRAKLADFGLARTLDGDAAKLTRSGLAMGTPGYMAPEQFCGLADHRSDIYALGALLYEMLTGEPPLGAFASPSKHQNPSCPPSDAHLDPVVLRALQPRPELRYQQAVEMGDALKRVRASLGRWRRFSRRAVVCLAGGGTVAAMAAGWRWRQRERRVSATSAVPASKDPTVLLGLDGAHEAAEFAARKGGWMGIEILNADGTRSHGDIAPGTAPPSEHFEITRIDFSQSEEARSLIPADLVRILRYPKFRAISLANASECLDEEAARALGSQFYLETLDLSGTNLSERWLKHLIPSERTCKLRVLLLRGVPLGEAGVSSLRQFGLSRLDLTDTGISPGLFASMRNLGGLICLDIGTTAGGAVDAYFRHALDECPDLQALGIAGTLQPQSFEGVESLVRCGCVMLEGMIVTPSMTSLLSKMPNLRSLCFYRCIVQHEAWRNLAGSPELRSLAVLDTQVFPGENKALSEIRQLARIVADQGSRSALLGAQSWFARSGRRLEFRILTEREKLSGTMWKCNNMY